MSWKHLKPTPLKVLLTLVSIPYSFAVSYGYSLSFSDMSLCDTYPLVESEKLSYLATIVPINTVDPNICSYNIIVLLTTITVPVIVYILYSFFQSRK